MTSLSRPQDREKLYAALETEHFSAYVLREDLSLEYVNAGWRRFARENGATELENDWDSYGPIPLYFTPPLRELFTAKARQVLELDTVWSHSYECSSDQVYRRFNLRAQATSQRDGLIVVHSLVAEPLRRGESSSADYALTYTDERGLIVQCSSCGRLRNPARARWDWTLEQISSERSNVSHGICPTCAYLYYG